MVQNKVARFYGSQYSIIDYLDSRSTAVIRYGQQCHTGLILSEKTHRD